MARLSSASSGQDIFVVNVLRFLLQQRSLCVVSVVVLLTLWWGVALIALPSASSSPSSLWLSKHLHTAPTQSHILSSSPNHIHFLVQGGLKVVTQAELDALHVRQRDECDRWEDTEDSAIFHRHHSDRWRHCSETNVSQWTCSACSYPQHDYHHSWGNGVEGSSARIPDRLYANHFNGSVPLHGFVHAVHESYRRHLPLTIAVEDIWIVIIQGLSQHINHNNNAERLRHHFVIHEGKQTIEVFAPSWEAMFAGFADEIAERTVAGRAELFARPFSSTSDIQSLLMQAALMEGMQAYFRYEATLICGIPSVRLLGTEHDWIDLHSRLAALRLSSLDPALAEWEGQLDRVVSAMVASRLAAVDVDFWQSLYRMRIEPFSMFMPCAGAPDSLDGHITSFFPYLTPDIYRHKYDDLERNAALLCSEPDPEECSYNEFSLSQLPSGVSRVPFVWMNAPWAVAGEEVGMKLYAGFDDASVVYEDGMVGGGEVRATYGWALSVH